MGLFVAGVILGLILTGLIFVLFAALGQLEEERKDKKKK